MIVAKKLQKSKLLEASSEFILNQDSQGTMLFFILLALHLKKMAIKKNRKILFY